MFFSFDLVLWHLASSFNAMAYLPIFATQYYTSLAVLSPQNRTLLSSFFSLSLIQGLNFILPLLTIPLTLRVVGASSFGVINYAIAIISYFQIFCDYGYNLTATRQVVLHKDDNLALSRIYSLTITAKLLLTLVSFVVLLGVVYAVPNLRNGAYIYILTFLAVIGQTLIPIWLYQGLEKVPIMALYNLLARSFYVLGLYVLLDKPDEAYLVPLLNGITMIMAGVLGTVYAFRKFKLRFILPSFAAIKQDLKAGWSVFFTGLSINAFINSNILVLGLFVPSAVVGWFSVADKMILLFRHTSSLVFQVLYPRVCALATETHLASVLFIRKIMRISGTGFFLAGVFLTVFSPWVVTLIVGHESPSIVTMIRIMAWVPWLTNLNLPAFTLLVIHEYKRTYVWILFSAFFFNLACNALLAFYFGANGTAATVLITELLITLALHFALHYFHKKHRYFLVQPRVV